MPRRKDETVEGWHARALHEAMEADAGVRQYLPLGFEEPDGGEPVTGEHRDAASRWRAAQEDLEAATKALPQ